MQQRLRLTRLSSRLALLPRLHLLRTLAHQQFQQEDYRLLRLMGRKTAGATQRLGGISPTLHRPCLVLQAM
ncbi:hypothetical protein RP29_06085 [Acidovorax temperans]|uniref:Uncharacterized protein n=1 Tax=Acidovorax temperans TaxID=80878 RepID=A0A0D7KBH9_9BURK|nr:hypothetical protein RP29_06085 [Acidovorax temperans]